jgi:hypothetical protein
VAKRVAIKVKYGKRRSPHVGAHPFSPKINTEINGWGKGHIA